MKKKEKIKAIELRKLGKSYNKILEEVRVSKSTLSLWLRDVKLSKNKKRELKHKQSLGILKSANKKRKDKARRIELIEKQAEKEFLKLKNNTLFISGLMLYWAEGSKSKRGEDVMFSNSDYRMIIFMIDWFKKFCNIPNKKFRVSIHIHELHSRKNVEKYWSKITKIPINQFYKTQIKTTSLKHRKNKLYNGTCSIKVHDRSLFRRIIGWINAFNEVEYFKEPS